MIKLKLKVAEKSQDTEIDIIQGELLNDAITRALVDVKLGEFKPSETFNVTVNGLLIEKDFWEFTKLNTGDNVLISPRIGDGDAGQLFKLAAIVVVAAYLGPIAAGTFGPVGGALVTAAATVAVSMALNALIPPPVPNIGEGFGASNVEESQMYTISGQSNTMRRLGTVPKVYGAHRMFPPLATVPYIELGVSTGDKARLRIQSVTFESLVPGNIGNSTSVNFLSGGTAGSELVLVSGRDITVVIQSGTSTAAQVVNSINNNAAAKALVTVFVSGSNGDILLATTSSARLSGGVDAGDAVQNLHAIYDFGLGKMKISDLMIGDTPLTSDSFKEFEYRFVDPNLPNVDEDVFDQALEREFKTYRNRRVITSLSISMVDGSESIQFSDVNTNADPQEFVLDFVAPQGLFGLSSSGIFGDRSVRMNIDFALVGTSDWRPYNDLNYVDNFSSVGGTDVTDFLRDFAYIAPDGAGYSSYYANSEHFDSQGINDDFPWGNGTAYSYIKPGVNKILVSDDARLAVGEKIFHSYNGGRFIGIVQSLNNIAGAFTEVTLDRVITTRYDLPVFLQTAFKDRLTNVTTYDSPPYQRFPVRFTRHELSAAIMVGNKRTPVYGNFRFTPKVGGQYKIRVKRITSFSDYTTSVSDAITWIGLSTAYKVSPIATTKRHVFLEVKIKATNQLNGLIQNLSAVVASALNTYNSNTETWSYQVTNNPAWVFVDLLTGEVNKKSVELSRLHLPSILEWAAFCAEVPTPPLGGTYTKSRFETNFILDYQATLQEVINQVCGAAQASLNVIEGKYGILTDKTKETPVQIFTPRNSRDFTSTRYYGLRPHGLKVKFIDPNTNWEVSEAIAYDNGYNAANATEFEEVTSFACTNFEQAWRFGRYMLAANRLRQETISLLVDFENLVCTRGDYVQITQDVMRVGGTPARVRSIDGTTVSIDDALDIDPAITYGYTTRGSDGSIVTSTCTPVSAREFQLDGDMPTEGDLIIIGEVGRIVFDCIVKSISPNDDLSANITLVEKADGIFDYESTDVLPDYDPQISETSNPEFKPPKAVTELTVVNNTWRASDTQSGYEYYVDLSWQIPQGSVYDFFEIWVNDGRGYKKSSTTTDKLFRYVVDQSRLDLVHGFKVVAVSASGKKLELVAMPEVSATPATKTDPPSDVDSFTLSITNQVLQLSWNQIADTDVKEYVIRFSPETNDIWESSVPLTTVSKSLNSTSVQARTGVYLIKAIDYAGNQSANAAIAVTTIPSLFDLNVIETMNEAPTFPGTKTDIELLGEALILKEAVPGDIDTVQYYTEGFYEFSELLDLDDIYSVRLQSQIRADGLKKGELMSDWDHLSDIDHLSTALHSDWSVVQQYRATDVFSSMADWNHLSEVDHLNFGAGVGFSAWRDIPTTGDATGRLFQFGVKLKSLTANVTPRVFDATIKADMPDRIDSFENLVSSAIDATVVTYETIFKGPGTTPNVQIGIDNAQTGDYYAFGTKTLEGFTIRFYDKTDVQVSRQFDVVAKGYGHRNTSSL